MPVRVRVRVLPRQKEPQRSCRPGLRRRRSTPPRPTRRRTLGACSRFSRPSSQTFPTNPLDCDCVFCRGDTTMSHHPVADGNLVTATTSSVLSTRAPLQTQATPWQRPGECASAVPRDRPGVVTIWVCVFSRCRRCQPPRSRGFGRRFTWRNGGELREDTLRMRFWKLDPPRDGFVPAVPTRSPATRSRGLPSGCWSKWRAAGRMRRYIGPLAENVLPMNAAGDPAEQSGAPSVVRRN